MSNAFQEQLLKTGLVSRKQAHKAKQDKNKKNKQHTINDKGEISNAQLASEKKMIRDRELNKRKEEQARQKSNSIEINQLITSNLLARDENCEIVYNFEHNKKVNRIYINAEMKQQIINGKLGIVRIEGRYELVPQSIAEKIQQRNKKRIVIFDEEDAINDNDYTSSEHQIPDNLTW